MLTVVFVEGHAGHEILTLEEGAKNVRQILSSMQKKLKSKSLDVRRMERKAILLKVVFIDSDGDISKVRYMKNSQHVIEWMNLHCPFISA